MTSKNKPKSSTGNDGAKETEPSNGNKDANDRNVLVLDSLQSWVICFATFVVFLMAAGFGRAVSMVFLDLVEQFDSTITITSFSYTLHTIGMSLTSILVTSLMVPATGERVAVAIGAVLGTFSVLLMGVSDSIWIFFILMTLKGIGSGISLIVSISLISKYFVRRRSLATSLANCGVSVGNIVAPPLVTILMENYNLRWIFLILGAVEMHTIAAAMLMRPLSRYSSVVESKRQDDSNDEDVTVPLSAGEKHEDKKLNGQMDKETSTSIKQMSEESKENERNCVDSISMEPLDSPIAKQQKAFPEQKCQNHHENGLSTRTDNGTKFNYIHTVSEDDSKMDNSPPDYVTSPSGGNGEYINGDSSYIEEPLLNQSSFLDESGTQSNKTRLQSDTMNGFKSSSWSVVSTHLSEFMIDAAVVASQVDVTSPKSATGKEPVCEETKKKSFCFRVKEVFMNAFNVRLLRSWTLWCLLLSAVTAMPGAYPGGYLPVIATKRGMDPDEVSILLMTGGFIDLFSRVFVGWFADTHLLKTTQIVAIASFSLGTLCHFTYFATSFKTLMAYTVVLGLVGGTRQSLGTLLTIQFMGQQLFLKALGFQTMFGIMSLAIHHPLLNTIMEASGSWNTPLSYCGVALYISAVLLLLEPVSKRLDVKFNVKLL